MNKPKTYTTVKYRGEAELIEKKSRFIGHAIPIKTEEEAQMFISDMRSKYYDATHNVYAYVLQENNIARFSDDGEPGGTAGLPMMEVLKKEGLFDVCVVVTRYFGGILLGAGGLVRAYTAAAKLAIDKAGIVTYEKFCEIRLVLSYSDYQKLLAKLSVYNAKIDNTEFGEDVTIDIAMRIVNEERFYTFVRELFNDRVKPERIGERYDIE